MLGFNRWAAILIVVALLFVTGLIMWAVVAFIAWWAIRLGADLVWYIKDKN